jgi:hypothetical protein
MEVTVSGCTSGARHWFTVYGAVRMRSPVCGRCGAPNPRPLSDDDWDALAAYVDSGGKLNPRTRAALAEHDGTSGLARTTCPGGFDYAGHVCDTEPACPPGYPRLTETGWQQAPPPDPGPVPRLDGDNIVFNWHNRRP